MWNRVTAIWTVVPAALVATGMAAMLTMSLATGLVVELAAVQAVMLVVISVVGGDGG